MQRNSDLDAVLETSSALCVLLSADCTIVAVNDAVLRASGRIATELVDRILFDVFPALALSPDAAAQMRRAIDQAVATAAPTLLPRIRVNAGRVQRDWRITYTPLHDRSGAVTQVLQQAIETTQALAFLTSPEGEDPRSDRTTAYVPVGAEVLGQVREVQEANRTLYAERLHLLRLLEEAPGFIVFLRGRDLVVELANRAFFELVGDRDAIGRPIREILPEVISQGHLELMDHVYRSGRPYASAGVQVVLQRSPNGPEDVVYLDAVLQPITELDGSVSGILAQGNNVTEQLRTQLELRRYREHLEELVDERTKALHASEAERRRTEAALAQAQKLEAVANLTGGVAHDFNNVLQLIGGNLQLLMQEADSPAVRARAEAAFQGVSRGARLAGQLLAFSRRQPLVAHIVDLRRLIVDMKELLKQAVGADIDVQLAVPEGPCHAEVDPYQLESVMLNLSLNARDALNERWPGGSRGTATVRIALRDGGAPSQCAIPHPGGKRASAWLALTVEDNGCGMAAALRERVFEPFFTTKAANGTGLGLSLVQRFAIDSGGWVELHSELGQGTALTLWLPRRSEPATWPEAVPAIATGAGAGELILVVEPDDDVRAVLAELLTDLGYEVMAAPDCASALALCQQAPPALLMTELAVPGTPEPMRLLESLRAVQPGLPVVIACAQPPTGDFPEEVLMLQKPFSREDLARALRQALPLSEATGNSGEAAQDAASAKSQPACSSVLLVEDDRALRSLTAECMMQLGYEVVACASRDEATQQAKGRRFDILFADVNLGGCSGIELAQELVGQWPQLRIVIASGEGPRDVGIEQAVFLQKPYDMKQLQDVLEGASEFF